MVNTQTHKSLIVIPSRMASTRLPGKPLADIGGMTLIERVYRQAKQAKFIDKVVIATDSDPIIEAGKKFSALVISTSDKNRTGSDRVAEVYHKFLQEGVRYDLIANVQGDMPFIKPKIIEQAFAALKDCSDDFGMVTIATPITSEEEFFKDSVVKVVTGTQDQALYFSRAPIPYPRNKPLDRLGLKHIGLYVFRPSVLEKMASLSSATTEESEGLEQLRLLANDIKIKVVTVLREVLEPSVEVDTVADLETANKIAQSNFV